MLAAAVATWGVGDVLAGTTFGSTAILTTSSGSTLLSVSTAASSVVGAAVSVIGKAEVQSLFPSSGKTTLLKIESTPASYSISGNENVTAPFSVMPKVYGQRRICPMLAAPSFNESGGNSRNELYTNEYLRMLFVLGYGPLDITQIKIGDTLLSDYEDVEWEVRAGYPDDAPPSLYTGAVTETSFNIQLAKSGNPPQTLGWQTQTTGEGADEIAIQITWPEGFWEVNDGLFAPNDRRRIGRGSPGGIEALPSGDDAKAPDGRKCCERERDDELMIAHCRDAVLGTSSDGATVIVLSTVTVPSIARSDSEHRRLAHRPWICLAHPLLALGALVSTRFLARRRKAGRSQALAQPSDPRHRPRVALSPCGDGIISGSPVFKKSTSADCRRRQHDKERERERFRTTFVSHQ